MFLHGSGECGTDIEIIKRNGPSKLVSEGKDFPFIIVSPRCPDKIAWNNKVLIALLDDVIAKYKVDEKRIYLTVLSSGGIGTWALAIEYPDKFAAVAPVSASSEPDDVCALKNIPAWDFYGAKDDVVQIKEDRDMVESLKQCGDDVKFTVYTQAGRDASTETYNNRELYEWFLKFKK